MGKLAFLGGGRCVRPGLQLQGVGGTASSHPCLLKASLVLEFGSRALKALGGDLGPGGREASAEQQALPTLTPDHSPHRWGPGLALPS